MIFKDFLLNQKARCSAAESVLVAVCENLARSLQRVKFSLQATSTGVDTQHVVVKCRDYSFSMYALSYMFICTWLLNWNAFEQVYRRGDDKSYSSSNSCLFTVSLSNKHGFSLDLCKLPSH